VRHWKPDGEIVRIIPARSRGRQPLSAGAKAGLLLVAAACFGTMAGLYEALGPRNPVEPGAEIEWSAVQKAPVRALSADEAAWEERGRDSPVAATSDSVPGEAIRSGSPRASGARNDAVRAAFSYCKWGGGTNCVVDGDTFYIGGEKVRVAGIDAPETHPSRCADEARLGNAATEQLHALLNSGAVTMTSIDRDRDRYGRLLRNVAVDGADVGEAMVSSGVAREYAGGRRPWCRLDFTRRREGAMKAELLTRRRGGAETQRTRWFCCVG
jgi:endonuclease YncB( thermonuclease family)